MERIIQNKWWGSEYESRAVLVRGFEWGLIGGLLGTLVMDIFMIGALTASGMPAFTPFTVIGDAAARFFGLLQIGVPGGVVPGAIAHYLIGPLLGVLFGLLAARSKAFGSGSRKQGILIAVAYVEIISMPLLVAAAVLLKMTPPETLEWFGISMMMHLIFGVFLGSMVSRGLLAAHPRVWVL